MNLLMWETSAVFIISRLFEFCFSEKYDETDYFKTDLRHSQARPTLFNGVIRSVDLPITKITRAFSRALPSVLAML